MGRRRIIVVGGGAAGIVAAGHAAELGTEVILLERMGAPGRKMNITGKGRCNLTNTAPLNEFLTRYGSNGKFLRQAFNQFFSDNLLEFLKRIGVETLTERGGRIFPVENDAPAVTKALIEWAAASGVSIRADSRVTELMLESERCIGVMIGKNEIRADAVVIATGGASYPATGSSGDGYRLAESAGHTVVPIRPALVPLETAGKTARRMMGLSLKNVRASVTADGKKVADDFGEMLFTHFGVSGPIILTLSRAVVDALSDRRHVEISLDLKPALDDKKLDARLLRDLDEHGKRRFDTMLEGLLPKSMIPVCCDLVQISHEKLSNQINSEERGRLRKWLKDFRLVVTGHRSFREAIVTAGGVTLKEINPRTMESRLVSGLCFAGEVLDIDGETGGYNLQAAFSTGWVAGDACSGGK